MHVNRYTYPGPDFLGVGPEKTGSTWLHTLLEDHPETWITPIKELLYFWEIFDYAKDYGPISRFLGNKWHHRRYRRHLLGLVHDVGRLPFLAMSDRESPIQLLKWKGRFLFGPRSDSEYARLFAPAQPGQLRKISGEISPQYFFLSEATVSHIADLFPNMRIILTIRDPIEWGWSFIRMAFRSDIAKISPDDPQFKNFFDRAIGNKPGFAASIEKWSRHFPSDQILVSYYDELSSDPTSYFCKVCRFLGISEFLPDQVKLQMNVGETFEMSPRFLVFLKRFFHHWVDDFERIDPNHANAWKSRWWQ